MTTKPAHSFILMTCALNAIASFNSNAAENKVLSGKTRHESVTYSNTNESHQSAFVDELTLNSCDIEVSTLHSDAANQVKITFANLTFIADGFTLTPTASGNCLLMLENGHGVK